MKKRKITDFDRGQWSVIQIVIAFQRSYEDAAELCREVGIGYSQIARLQADCGDSFHDEVEEFVRLSKNGGEDLHLQD